MDRPPPPRTDQVIIMVVEVIMYCFHFSVIILMIFRRKTVFNSAFYYILLTICVADLLYFIFVSMLANRFISYGFFAEFYLDNQWIAAAGFTLSNVLGYGQFVGQTLISINRFTVFWVPAKHKEIWKRKWYLIVLIGLPLLVIPTRLPNVGKIVFSKSGAAATYADENMENRALYMTSAVYFINGTITAVLSVFTVFKYWRLRVGNVMPIPQIEARMLAFSIVIYCIQMLRVVYVQLRNLFLPYPSIIAFLMYLLPFISDLHAWVCSISLVCMSQASRKAYIEFYFGNVSLRAPKILFLSSLTPPAPHDNQWIAAAGFTLSNVFGYGQFVGQTLISINRFTVFWLPAKHKRIWARKWYLVVLIGLPLLVIPTRLPNVGKIVFSKSGAAATYADEVMETRALYTTSTVYFVNGTITAILSVLTIFKYWRLRVGNVMPIPQIEARMLGFSIVIYSIQMLRVVYVVIRNIFLPYPSINAFLMYLLPFISDLHAWVCSISLVCMSQASRKAYIDFYFGNVRAPKILFLSSLTPPAPHGH